MKKILQVILKSFTAKVVFIAMGLASTLWFLIRVVPKPQRATYPCMQAAAPVMSGFIIYLLSIGSSVFLFRKFTRKLIRKEYHLAFALIAVCLIFGVWAGATFNQEAKALKLVDANAYTANDPIGVPKGLQPGRVVWVWYPEATDESCTNETGDRWYANTDQHAVDVMMHEGITNYAGVESITAAWNAIFQHFNSNHGKGNVGYVAGEKVYIKINITNSCCSVTGTEKTSDFERMDATPEVALAILKQLVENVGVEESDIYIGDPFRTFHNLYWNTCHTVYPDVNYCDGEGINGRHQTVPSSGHLMKFSDGDSDWRIPQEYVDAAYFINMPCLKSHESGGITIAAKNHQGSVLQDGVGSDAQSAYDMHYALPDHDDTDGGSHRYRHLVDYMGHEHLGGKTLLVIVDAIWAGKNWQGWVEKWQMTPFDNDYPNSLFISQDLVAIESVGWDFLLEEYASKPSDEQYPYMSGTEDYILQAADPANWPSGVSYDPEDDGSELGSLGVYEHWDNATDKNYTSIDFVKVFVDEGSEPNLLNNTRGAQMELAIYPNPSTDNLFVEFALQSPSEVSASLLSMDGRRIRFEDMGQLYSGSQQLNWQVNEVPAGSYLLQLEITSNGKTTKTQKRIQIL